jgi:hypothetical protein
MWPKTAKMEDGVLCIYFGGKRQIGVASGQMIQLVLQKATWVRSQNIYWL